MFSKTLTIAATVAALCASHAPSQVSATITGTNGRSTGTISESRPRPATVGKILPYSKLVAGAPNPFDRTVKMRDVFVVERNASFLQLELVDVRLPGSSYLEVVSMRDGDSQRLTQADVRRGALHTAYFNGDALLVRLYAGPRATAPSVTFRSLAVGNSPQPGTDSLCGSDNRINSNHPAIGRMLVRRGTTVGVCTGWLIGRNSSFATAGHCLNGAGGVTVQFNVPQSTAGGAIVNPPAADQHGWFSWTRQFQDSGKGKDWGVFRTSATAFTRQNSLFGLRTPSKTTAVVTGCGSAGGTRNFTQKYHWGSITRAGDHIKHKIDTTGGNSGSPILVQGRAIGVHTHGGCGGWFGRNHGTGVRKSNFAAAMTAIINQ